MGAAAEQALALPGGRRHLLGWLTDSVAQSTAYECSVVSRAGSATSRVLITVQDADSAGQDGWTKEFHNWRTAISEHDKMMQNWKKTWESCNKKNTP